MYTYLCSHLMFYRRDLAFSYSKNYNPLKKLNIILFAELSDVDQPVDHQFNSLGSRKANLHSFPIEMSFKTAVVQISFVS